MTTRVKNRLVAKKPAANYWRVYFGIGLIGIALAGGLLYWAFGRSKSVDTLAADLAGSNPHLRKVAARELSALGPNSRAALPQLTVALKDPDKRVRHATAKTLSELGLEAQPAAKALIDALAEPEADTRYYVVKALSKVDLSKDHVDAVPGLIRLLKDPNPKVRYYAAKCLKDIGPAARAAIPALKAAAEDANTETKDQVVAALQKVSRAK